MTDPDEEKFSRSFFLYHTFISAMDTHFEQLDKSIDIDKDLRGVIVKSKVTDETGKKYVEKIFIAKAVASILGLVLAQDNSDPSESAGLLCVAIKELADGLMRVTADPQTFREVFRSFLKGLPI